MENKKKIITQFLLELINFYSFRIIKIIAALLAFGEHFSFFDTSQTSVENQDSINNMTRKEHGDISMNSYSKENGNQVIWETH